MLGEVRRRVADCSRHSKVWRCPCSTWVLRPSTPQALPPPRMRRSSSTFWKRPLASRSRARATRAKPTEAAPAAAAAPRAAPAPAVAAVSRQARAAAAAAGRATPWRSLTSCGASTASPWWRPPPMPPQAPPRPPPQPPTHRPAHHQAAAATAAPRRRPGARLLLLRRHHHRHRPAARMTTLTPCLLSSSAKCGERAAAREFPCCSARSGRLRLRTRRPQRSPHMWPVDCPESRRKKVNTRTLQSVHDILCRPGVQARWGCGPRGAAVGTDSLVAAWRSPAPISRSGVVEPEHVCVPAAQHPGQPGAAQRVCGPAPHRASCRLPTPWDPHHPHHW